ncbi:hypothetical protein B0J12DRAFT_243974 [Macrophomina phaseolina]|uniref:Uncharacterized protein n=1 Tax=Macrophomina phaseolina TaxID=35725 RepID=A0ABQ8G2X1_9PEZI|nr:hypothetical protein B0J12DRAFT_243974 [Macrophomina phaseolina]
MVEAESIRGKRDLAPVTGTRVSAGLDIAVAAAAAAATAEVIQAQLALSSFPCSIQAFPASADCRHLRALQAPHTASESYQRYLEGPDRPPLSSTSPLFPRKRTRVQQRKEERKKGRKEERKSERALTALTTSSDRSDHVPFFPTRCLLSMQVSACSPRSNTHTHISLPFWIFPFTPPPCRCRIPICRFFKYRMYVYASALQQAGS